MEKAEGGLINDNRDDYVDDEISSCLDLDHPRSFFLSADAGSGKTRSLVIALSRVREKSGERLRLYGQRVGVITYTNAACDVINSRLEFDPLFQISTIHSFVWSIIDGLHSDIKQWLRVNIAKEIAGLEDQQRRGRPGSGAALQRDAEIKFKKDRLEILDSVRRFIYSPTGDNRGRDSLNHAEVIKIGADFLNEKPLMQRILVTKFPILLIDESHDTNKLLMEAFLHAQAEHKGHFCLGLFGDLMQRVYADGKADLGRDLPSDWMMLPKVLNHRSPRRIIRLINKIRASVDGHEQLPRSDSEEGFIRLFVFSSGVADKMDCEHRVSVKMAGVTGDEHWSGPDADVKTLILEHHMAARRMGFERMFAALDSSPALGTGLRDGSLPGIRLFSELVLPLKKANTQDDGFAVAAIVRKASPLLTKNALLAVGPNQRANINSAQKAVRDLAAVFTTNNNPRFVDVLDSIYRTGLFEIPESLVPIATLGPSKIDIPLPEDAERDPERAAWSEFAVAPFAEIEPYAQYVNGKAPFDTHQGVKGLEFPRVMVVIDDSAARGFMFSYEKLFGAKGKTRTDVDHEREGTEGSIDRTRRLLYVSCSRARKSLAVVAYSVQPEKVKQHVVGQGWFEPDEVELW